MVDLNKGLVTEPEIEETGGVLQMQSLNPVPKSPVQEGTKVGIAVEHPDDPQEQVNRSWADKLFNAYMQNVDYAKQLNKLSNEIKIGHRIPYEYRQGYYENGQWYSKEGKKLPPPPEEFIEGVHESLPVRVGKFLLGDYLGDPGRVMSEIATGDKYQIRDNIQGLLNDASGLIFWTGPAGQATFEAGKKALLYAIEKGLTLPRFAYRKAMSMIPEVLRPSHVLEGVWERIIVPPFKQRVIPTTEGMKSVAEIMQPAVERLEKVPLPGGKGTLASPFRNAMVQKSLVTKLGEDIGREIQNMPPKLRFEAFKALRGLPAAPEGEKVVTMMQKGIKKIGVRKTFEDSYWKALEEQLQKPRILTTDDSALLDMPNVERVLNIIDDQVHSNRNVKEIQKALNSAIEDPVMPKDLRALAMDLYNLPYSTVEAVGAASRKAAKSYLIAGLKRSGVIKAALPEGENKADWMISKIPGIEGSWVPRDVELELRAIKDVPKIAARAWGKYFMTPWKVNKVILTPATHIRNTVSNIILNDIGGLPFYRVDYYKRALNELINNGKYWKKWQKITGSGGTFSLNELQQMQTGLKYGSNMIDKALSWFDQKTVVPKEMYNAEEQLAKVAKFMWNIEHNNMTPTEAALDAMKWTLNYGEVTRFTANVRGSVAPFYTWTSKVIPLMAEQAVKHPFRLAKWWLFYQALQEASLSSLKISDSEFDYIHKILPAYVQDGQFLLLPWRDDDNRLQFLNLSYMIPGFGDWVDITTDPVGNFMGTPLIQIAGSLALNKTYSGAPIWLEEDLPSTKLMKGFSFLWRQVVPNSIVMPGSLNWNKMWDSMQDRPGSLTAEQILANEAGFKIVPIDPAIAAKQKKIIEQIHRQEVGAEMKRELRKARSASEAKKVIQKYNNLRLKLERETSGMD